MLVCCSAVHSKQLFSVTKFFQTWSSGIYAGNVDESGGYKSIVRYLISTSSPDTLWNRLRRRWSEVRTAGSRLWIRYLFKWTNTSSSKSRSALYSYFLSACGCSKLDPSFWRPVVEWKQIDFRLCESEIRINRKCVLQLERKPLDPASICVAVFIFEKPLLRRGYYWGNPCFNYGNICSSSKNWPTVGLHLFTGCASNKQTFA